MDRCGEASATAKLSALTLQDRSTFSVRTEDLRLIYWCLEKEDSFRRGCFAVRSGGL